jgi:hypothetical protein
MKARDEFPGTEIPDPKKDPDEYLRWWRRMAMWSYKWGPYLLSLEDKHAKTGSGRHGDGRAR